MTYDGRQQAIGNIHAERVGIFMQSGEECGDEDPAEELANSDSGDHDGEGDDGDDDIVVADSPFIPRFSG